MEGKKEEIAQLVKSSRMAKGFTQQELADKVGISLRSVQRIESGDVLPRYYTLKLLATELHFSAELLRDTLPEKATESKSKRLTRTQQIIATVVSGLIIFLLAGAFLAQSANFPETMFELFIFLAVVIGGYGIVLFRIWR